MGSLTPGAISTVGIDGGAAALDVTTAAAAERAINEAASTWRREPACILIGIDGFAVAAGDDAGLFSAGARLQPASRRSDQPGQLRLRLRCPSSAGHPVGYYWEQYGMFIHCR